MTDHVAIASTWMPLLIFFARVTDVSIGTLRLICIVRGHKPFAVILSFAEILIWIFAITNVLTHLDQPLNILAYAGGYATGSAVGMWIEGKLALGMQIVTFVSRGSAHAVAERMRLADHTVTTLAGHGEHGPVAICHAVLPRKLASTAIRMARDVDPDVVVTIEDARTTNDYTACHGSGKSPTPWRRFAFRPNLGGRPSLVTATVMSDRPSVPEDGGNTPLPQAA